MTSLHHRVLARSESPGELPTHVCDSYVIDRDFARDAAYSRVDAFRYVCAHGRDIIVRGPEAVEPPPPPPRATGFQCSRCGAPSGTRRKCERCLSVCAACAERPRRRRRDGTLGQWCVACSRELWRGKIRGQRKREVTA